MKIYRVLDANLNRVSEGLRVLEDIQRFIYDDEKLSKELRSIRHKVRKTFQSKKLLESRNSSEDVGLNISKGSRLDEKTEVRDLLISNFKRVEEGLRSIEESLKIVGEYEISKEYEELRYRVYQLEQKALLKVSVLNSDIYAILGEEFSKGRTNLEVLEELIKADVKIVQYREKNKTKKEKYEECLVLRKRAKEAGVFFIVNDDFDIALAVDADGLHIGQDDGNLEVIKAAAPHLVVGLSTHNEEEAIEAVELGADYIGVGAIYHTETKKDLEDSEGLDYLKWVSENIDIPYVAIGGIKEENILEVKEHGGYCFAMISELVGADNIHKKVNSIREKIKEDKK